MTFSVLADVLKVKWSIICLAEVYRWINNFLFFQHNKELVKERDNLKLELYKRR